MINTQWKKPEKLGSGAYGTVYSNKKHEAVKISYTVDGWDKTQSCLREIHALRHLNSLEGKSKFFVQLKKVKFFKDKVHMFMNRADGNLTCIKSKDLSADTIERYAIQLFNGLFAMRNHKIFHRDIKPENILVDLQTSTLSYCDFGLSRHLLNDTAYGTGYIVTRWYRSPELLEHQKKFKRKRNLIYTEKMDVYSIGAILYELIFDAILAPGKTIEDSLGMIQRRVNRLTTEKLMKHGKITEKVAKCLIGVLKIKPSERFNCARALYALGELTADEVFQYQEKKNDVDTFTLKYAPIQPPRDYYTDSEWDERSKYFMGIVKFNALKKIIAFALNLYDHFNPRFNVPMGDSERFVISVAYATMVLGSWYDDERCKQLIKYLQDNWIEWGETTLMRKLCEVVQYTDITTVSAWEEGKYTSFSEYMEEALKNPYKLKRKRD